MLTVDELGNVVLVSSIRGTVVDTVISSAIKTVFRCRTLIKIMSNPKQVTEQACR